jgi:hypothetical protein
MRDVDVDPEKLTALLAGRLAAIVPAGIRVEAADGMLWYSHSGGPGRAGTYVRDNFEAHGDTAEERLTGVSAQALRRSANCRITSAKPATSHGRASGRSRSHSRSYAAGGCTCGSAALT